MAYRFKHGQTVPQNVKRIAAEQLDSAIALLKGKRGVRREDSVHGVRKSIKKTRALLRMVRPELGDFFPEENFRLRDIGRKLSDLRDAGALIGTVNHLRHRQNGGAPKKLLGFVRRFFGLQKRQLEEQAAARKLLPNLAVELRKARRSIGHWPLETDGFKAIADGLEQTFRAGRKALAAARRSGRIEDFHEWRKRVKDHWYQVRLLNKIWGEVMSGYEQSLKDLEDTLGEDVNLWLLENQVQQLASEDGARLAMSSLHRAVGSARDDFEKRALKIGAKVYAEKPREFTRELKRLWKAW
ncbi:MAG TPA: CHAD domain-containing protein [Bryobacteraceae bacterium]|nr:CHAD domain-containing protein [Bryobacteraceae bacterium]